MIFEAKENQNKFYAMVKAAVDAGQKYSEIGPQATAEGWVSKTGMPVTATMVSQFMTKRGFRRMKPFKKGKRYVNHVDGMKTKGLKQDRRTKAYKLSTVKDEEGTPRSITVNASYTNDRTWETEVLEVLAGRFTKSTKVKLLAALIQD